MSKDSSPKDKIYEVVKKIPKGSVATYGQVAEMAGNKNWARVVGNVLHNNPYPGIVPCHRVVNARGDLAANFGFGGAKAQEELLKKEGVTVVNGRVDLLKYAGRVV